MRTNPWLTLIIVLLCPALSNAQYTSNPPIIAYDNCELDPVWQWGGDRTKKWSYWTGADHTLPGSASTASMTRSSVVARKGTYSYKARITKNPNFSDAANTHRSEMAFSTPGQAPLAWEWAAVSMYLPPDFCIDQSPMSVAFNTKANPDNYSTPFRMDIRGGRYIAIRANIQTNGSVTGEVEKDLGPVEKGVWVDWVYHRNFKMDASGFIEIYKNGTLVMSYNGPNWVHGAGRSVEAYLHTGIYKWPWLDPNGKGWGPPACNNPVEVYYDEYRFGYANATLQHFLIDQQAPAPKPVAPTIAKPVTDISTSYNTKTYTVPLAGVFADDKGVGGLQLSVAGNSNINLIKTATISGSNLLLGIGANESGFSDIRIKATDEDGLSAEDVFRITVQPPVQVAPKVLNPIADQTLAFNTTAKSIPLGGVFSDDQPATQLAYTVSGNSNAALIPDLTVTGSTLALVVAPGLTGSSTITIRATDADGLFITDQFVVNVLPKPAATTLLINSGGAAVNFGGKIWSADRNFSGGNIYSTTEAISGTIDDSIYQSERYGNMGYAIPLTAGLYNVRLHFAEIFFTTTNQRIFDVNVENNQGVLTGYDIVAEAGGAYIAKIEEFKNVSVTDGVLNINLVSVMDNAKISAIEILSAEEPNEAPKLATAIADQQVPVNVSSKTISIANVFTDDKGAAGLTYTIAGNSKPALVTSSVVSGTNLVLGFSGTAAGTSQIILRATDSAGLSVQDTFNITITNALPVARAGADQTITLPTAQVTLNGAGTDTDGTIKSYTWTQISGPPAVFSSKNIAKPVVSGITTAGTYTFQLTVTDNINATSAADQVNVIVKPIPGLHIGSFTLINASTDQDVITLTEGMQINLATAGNSLNIRANSLPVIAGKVVFNLTGETNFNSTESAAPFALFGDADGNFESWTPAVGTYTLTATPYSTSSGEVAGVPLTITFTVVNQTAAGSRTVTFAESTTPLSTTDKSARGLLMDNSEITYLQAYPNPFTSQVTISFKAAKAAKAKLEIINSEGKIVQRWPEENVYPEMMYRKNFNGSNLPNGIYIYRITTSLGEIKTGKVVLAK